MRKLEGYTKYPFEGVEVGRSKFAEFVLTTINRLIASGVAAYAQIIADITAAYNEMFGEISLHEQNFSNQMTETKAVKLIRKDFAAVVDKVESAVHFKYGKGSEQDNLFFPHGITPYKTAPLHDLQIKMEELTKFCEDHQGDLGAPLFDEVKAVRDAFIAERDKQLQMIGKVKSIIPNYQEKQDNMIVLLYDAMLLILRQNLRNPAAMLTFFDEQLIWIKRKNNNESEVEPYYMSLNSQERKVADISFSVDDTLILTHISGGELQYYFAATADEEPPATPEILVADEEVEIKCNTIGAPDKKFLIIINPNDQEAQVQIVLA
jgi:hypothetical protein